MQALGAVNRDDLDQRLVVLETQFGLLVVLFVELLGEPGEQRRHAGTQQRLLLQQFAEMQQVGQASFTLLALRKPRADLETMQQCLEHGDKTVVLPAVLQRGQVIQPFLPTIIVIGNPGYLRVIEVEQRRCQRAAQLHRVGVTRYREQQLV